MITKQSLRPLRFSLPMLIAGLAAALLLSACLPSLRAPEDTSPGAIYTSAAQTIMAQLTLSAGQTAVAQLTQIAQPSAAPLTPATAIPTILPPSATAVSASATLAPSATFTAIPTATATPTATPTATFFVPTVMPTYLPTATWSPPTATATPAPVPCNAARFVADVTVPDGTIFPPGQAFTKTWRLRNIGSCAWMPGYSLVFHSGDRMHTSSTVPLNITVYPGATANLSINLIAPSQPGGYRSYWMLSTAGGQLFGIGANANSPFWVDIKVTTATVYAFDFIQQMCNATWRSNTGALSCPGNPGSLNGAVLIIEQPTLETGKMENEPALMTLPAQSQDGWISGVYPAYIVQAGDRFNADLGCLIDSVGCDVTFFLSAQIVGGAQVDIASWHEVYDQQITRANVDLTFLAGQTVQFILRVVNHGVPAKATAFWLVPSIRR